MRALEPAVDRRQNVFAIHSWEDAERCRRMESLLRATHQNMAHYTILPERALSGTPDQVAEDIVGRIGFATSVVVINTPGLHRRATARLEMQAAVRMRKRIVVVQPHGSFEQPIPADLNNRIYRVAPWRSDVVGRAIRGEYPQDGRVFDVAELADRRALVGILSAGVVFASFAVIVHDLMQLRRLRQDLSRVGVNLEWDGNIASAAGASAWLGGAIGACLGLLSGDRQTALLLAGAGALVGAASAAHHVYKARLLGAQQLRILTVEQREERAVLV